MNAKTAHSVSVIVPAYNAGLFLADALHSVLMQDRVPNEIIVVNDGSTDDTEDVLIEFGAKVICVSQTNQGIGAARNAGLGAAHGDIIAFLDADDLWPSHSLSCRLDKLLESPGIGLAYGAVEQFVSPHLETSVAASLFCPPGQLLAPHAGGCLIRRELFDRVGLYRTDIIVGETIDWILRARDCGESFGVVNETVMHRRIHGSNTVLQNQDQRTDYLKILRQTLDRRRALTSSGR